MKWLLVREAVMLEVALSSQLALVGSKPGLPTFSELTFCQMPPPWSVLSSNKFKFDLYHRITEWFGLDEVI